MGSLSLASILSRTLVSATRVPAIAFRRSPRGAWPGDHGPSSVQALLVLAWSRFYWVA